MNPLHYVLGKIGGRRDLTRMVLGWLLLLVGDPVAEAVERLGAEDLEIRTAAQTALAALGPAAAPALRAALGSPDPERRGRAGDLLARLVPREVAVHRLETLAPHEAADMLRSLFSWADLEIDMCLRTRSLVLRATPATLARAGGRLKDADGHPDAGRSRLFGCTSDAETLARRLHELLKGLP